MTGRTFCIFSANYLPNVGGLERYTKNLAYELAAQGDKAIIVTSNVFLLPEREALAPNIEIVRLPCYRFLGGRCPVSRKNERYKFLYDQLMAEQIDYVMVNTRFYRHSLEGVRLAEQKGIRPIVVDHGSAHLTLGNPVLDIAVAGYEHAITNRLKRHDVDYYAVSQASCAWIEHFGISSQGVLNNSIDAASFRAAASGRDFRAEQGIGNKTVISYIGRFIPEKGIVPMLDAAELLQGEDVTFFLAGDGPLKRDIESRGLSNVRLLGRLEGPEVADLLLTSDAFCLPTRSEGFSTALLECAACATPPIVTRVGGVDELLPGGDGGFILEHATASEIASHIRSLAQQPEMGKEMGKRLQNRVDEEFSWASTANKVRAACEKANEGGHI